MTLLEILSLFAIGAAIFIILLLFFLIHKHRKEKDALSQFLIINEKYASIGKLISNISHQIINPLGSILIPIEIIKAEMKVKKIENKNIQDAVDSIKRNIQRIEDTIQSLKILSYSGPNKMENIKISVIINSIILLISNDIKKRISFKLDFDETILIYSNASLLSNMLMNVIQNSIDSIENIGTIIISVTGSSTSYTITVKDDGIGIRETDFPYIFNIDFTTKEMGKGTGQGLYIVKQLAEKLNLAIEVESKMNQETVFKFTKA